MPVGRVFVGRGDAGTAALVERPADELQPDRQAVAIEAAGHRHARQAGQVDRDRQDVRQVHLERIAGARADRERRARRGRHRRARRSCSNASSKSRRMSVRTCIAFEIVRVVVAGRQRVGAEHDAALYLGRRSRRRGSRRTSRAALVPRPRGSRSARRRSARGSTTPRPWRRCSRWPPRTRCAAATLRRCSRRRASSVVDRRAHGARRRRRRGRRRSIRSARRGACPSTPVLDVAPVVGNRRVDRRGVARVLAGDGFEQHRGAAHGGGQRADLIERRRERDHAVAADPPVGGLHADDAAVARGQADRAAGVGAEACRAPGARRPQVAEPPEEPPGTRARSHGLRVTPSAEFSRGRAHRELVHVELADQHGAGLAQPLGDGAVEARHEVLEDLRARTSCVRRR